MSINKVILVGNVGKDPEVRFFDNNVSKASFSLATSEKYKNKNGEVVTNTEWHNIVAWRGLAQTIEKYVKKGSLLYVEGKITYRTFDGTDGQKKYFTEILADSIKMLNRIDDGSRSQSSNQNEDVNTNQSSSVGQNSPQTNDITQNGEINQPENTQEDTDDLPF
ncbi:MAG: single-stranded DNA-binding protein [Bacteroidales bacterium]|nr:single-stranded DNA-binding protein [Bacteroidales bacterium]